MDKTASAIKLRKLPTKIILNNQITKQLMGADITVHKMSRKTAVPCFYTYTHKKAFSNVLIYYSFLPNTEE